MSARAVPIDASRAVCGVALGGAALLALSMPLTWGSLRVATTGASGRLTGAPVVCALLAVAIVAIVAGTLLALGGSDDGARLAGVVALVVAAVVALFTLGSELIASLVPVDVVPAVARRLTLSGGAGPGAWIALLGAAAVAMASFELTRGYALDAADAVLTRGRAGACALGALALALVGLVQLRQEPWIDTPVDRGAFAIEGAAIPWLGVGTFAGACLLVVAIALVCRDYWADGGWAAIAAAVLVGGSAALAIGCAGALGLLGLHHWQPRAAAWATLALGTAIGLIGGALLRTSDPLEPRAWDDPLFQPTGPSYDPVFPDDRDLP